MGSLGMPELLVIALAVLILFGGKKIPEFMRGLGRGIREFNDAKDNVKRELEEGIKEKEQTKAPSATSNEYQDFVEWKKQQAQQTASSLPQQNN